MENASHQCEGYNPLCGDKVNVFLKMNEAGTIEDVSFMGSGCAIFKASASFMTVHLKGKSQKKTREMASKFVEMVKGNLDPSPIDGELGKLTIFQGVREFPSRVKCATLAWHALTCAMDKVENDTTGEILGTD
jgi:nitrogen fixation NifU-like protein